jgi:CheY-like chemotaxis protein
MLKRVIGEDIVLVTELYSGVGRVKVDRGQLSQIIMNLAVNARDAMPDGGQLTVETANVFFDPEQAKHHTGLLPGAYVKLLVRDDGTGIAEEVRHLIFEPFFTTKEVGKGTGLGLATVYGIVKQSGGYLVVSSEVGQGSTFEVFLPRVVEEVSGELPKAVLPSELPSGPETILLVEDEDAVRSLLRETLESCGYKVIEAADGHAALEAFEQASDEIDLLITDVVMPHMGGRELAEELAKLRPGLPVLFVSGYTDDIFVRERVLDANVNFIRKPFSLEAISIKLRELLDY